MRQGKVERVLRLAATVRQTSRRLRAVGREEGFGRGRGRQGLFPELGLADAEVAAGGSARSPSAARLEAGGSGESGVLEWQGHLGPLAGRASFRRKV